MTEMPYVAGTAEAAAVPGAGETPRYDEVGLGGGNAGDLDAFTVDDGLPPRQDARNAVWGDSPQYDEPGLGGGYDGDLDAFTVDDGLPPRQDARNAVWGDSPQYDEPGLGGGYAGDLGSLTAEEQTLDGTAGDQERAAAAETPLAAGKSGDSPAEVSGGSAAAAPEHEVGIGPATEAAPAGAPADKGSTAEANAGVRPDGAAQPDDSHADPDARLKELEASLKDLKSELQAVKDLWQPVSDAPGDIGSQADQPRHSDRKLLVDQQNPEEPEHQDDRPGLWSNAKYALYGAIGTTVGMTLLDQFAPGVSRVVEDMLVGVPTVVGALVPAMREGWKRKHDDSPDER